MGYFYSETSSNQPRAADVPSNHFLREVMGDEVDRWASKITCQSKDRYKVNAGLTIDKGSIES